MQELQARHGAEATQWQAQLHVQQQRASTAEAALQVHACQLSTCMPAAWRASLPAQPAIEPLCYLNRRQLSRRL